MSFDLTIANTFPKTHETVLGSFLKHPTTCLAEVPVGERVQLVSVNLQGVLGKRLADLGFTTGAFLTPLRWGPKESLVAILIRSTVIAIRRSEAENLIVVGV